MNGTRRQISLQEFEAAAAPARTLSRIARPASEQQAWRCVATVREFLDAPTYPVRYVDSSGSRLVPWHDPDANPIRFRDFVAQYMFAWPLVRGRPRPDERELDSTDAVALHCSGCDRFVVIAPADGTHRLTWLAFRSRLDAEVRLPYLSGAAWEAGTPDVDVVCVRRGTRRSRAVRPPPTTFSSTQRPAATIGSSPDTSSATCTSSPRSRSRPSGPAAAPSHRGRTGGAAGRGGVSGWRPRAAARPRSGLQRRPGALRGFPLGGSRDRLDAFRRPPTGTEGYRRPRAARQH